jgi:hypothetical protein
MDSAPNVNPLSQNEIVYRRIPLSQMDNGQVQLVAFKPHETQDTDGLSLSRECCGPSGAAATGLAPKQFMVAQTLVAEVEQIDGLTVHADSDDHALVPQMTSALRRSKVQADRLKCETWARQLMLLFKRRPFHGPLAGKATMP